MKNSKNFLLLATLVVSALLSTGCGKQTKFTNAMSTKGQNAATAAAGSQTTPTSLEGSWISPCTVTAGQGVETWYTFKGAGYFKEVDYFSDTDCGSDVVAYTDTSGTIVLNGGVMQSTYGFNSGGTATSTLGQSGTVMSMYFHQTSNQSQTAVDNGVEDLQDVYELVGGNLLLGVEAVGVAPTTPSITYVPAVVSN